VQGDVLGVDNVARLGRAAQGAQDVAADRVEVLVWKIELEVLVHVGDGDAAIYGVGVLANGFDGCLVLVELVLYLPDDLL
jgi:hypothetical protein